MPTCPASRRRRGRERTCGRPTPTCRRTNPDPHASAKTQTTYEMRGPMDEHTCACIYTREAPKVKAPIRAASMHGRVLRTLSPKDWMYPRTNRLGCGPVRDRTTNWIRARQGGIPELGGTPDSTHDMYVSRSRAGRTWRCSAQSPHSMIVRGSRRHTEWRLVGGCDFHVATVQ